MAAKKKASDEAPVPMPLAFTTEDGHRMVARTQVALAKKWKASPSKSVAGAVQIAWFMVALGREREAREIVDQLSDDVQGGGDALWEAASSALALAARLARLAGDEPRRAALVARLEARPALPVAPPTALAAAIKEADKDVRSAEVDPSQKFACEGFARGLARAAYFRELGVGDVDALERTIGEALAGLRAQLGR